jgi:hypothetical protein
VYVPFGILLIKGEAGCLLVTRHADDVADECEGRAFSVVAMHEPARIEAAQLEAHAF